jgi:uncharacterized protein YndB with AHSA1/START domain
MIKVRTSTVINAPLDKVWAMASNFNGLPNWHPTAGSSEIEAGKANNEVGCVRNFQISEPPGRVRETLLAMSALDHTIVYDMLGGPLPFVDYVSTMHFESITDGDKTYAVWSAEFDVSDGKHDHWGAFVRDEVFLGGFKALEASL